MHIAGLLLLPVFNVGVASCTLSKCNTSTEDVNDEISLLHHYTKITRSGTRETHNAVQSSNTSENLHLPIQKAAQGGYTIPMGNLINTTRAQYGETTAYRGKIYFTPHDALHLLILDTATDVLTAVPTDSIQAQRSPTGCHWLGIVGYEGKIYCAPCMADQLLVYDTEALSLSGVPTSSLTDAYATWNGIAAWDRKIYAAPFDADVLLVYDLASKNISGVPTSSVCTGTGKWMGLIAHDGKLYSAPIDMEGFSDCNQLLIYDITSDKVSGVSTASISTGPWKWHGMALLNSKVYAVPAGATAILIYDTETGEVSGASTEHIDKGLHKWAGLTAYGGKIYGGAQQNGEILMYDPETRVVSSLCVSSLYDAEFANLRRSALPPSTFSGDKMLAWNGIAGWNGKLYEPPYDAGTVLVYNLPS